MQFVLATKNKNKLKEMQRILEPLGASVISESDLEYPLPEVEEDADTFEGNALKKARSAMQATKTAAIADDSGLCVDYLGGAPGIYSARYAGEEHDSNKNNEKLLNQLKNVPKEKRTAHFVCAIAVVFPNGEYFTVRGTCNGYIADKKQGVNGFGYDPLFISEKGCFGLLSDKEKDSISHRGNALRQLKEKLKNICEEMK